MQLPFLARLAAKTCAVGIALDASVLVALEGLYPAEISETILQRKISMRGLLPPVIVLGTLRTCKHS